MVCYGVGGRLGRYGWHAGIIGFSLLTSGIASAEGTRLDSGDTAWMLTSMALVLLMTIPGLALFYGGLVRTKNVLSVLMQCVVITSLVTLLWALFGYSLTYGPTGMIQGRTSRSTTSKATTTEIRQAAWRSPVRAAITFRCEQRNPDVKG